MDIKDVLQLTDHLFFSETGKYLDPLQEAILKGTLEGKKYSDIAQNEHCTEGHVRNIGSELWKILSDALGKEVTKVNCKSILEKVIFYNQSPIIGRDNVTVNNNLNFCKTPQLTPTSPHPQQTQTEQHLDLVDAPEIINFYNRTNELATLENWIIEQRCRLIALMGVSGSGKTTLAVRLINQIKSQFNYIIYRHFRFCPTLEATLTNLLQIFSPETEISNNIETQISQLLHYLRKYRCLIVFDDIQMLFNTGQLVGSYQPGREDYSTFFRQLGEFCHNSSILLLSWEKPREIAAKEGDNQPVRSLQIKGLGVDAGEIFKEKGLVEEEKWQQVIELYGGNPLYLKIIAEMIQDLLGGCVSKLLDNEGVFLGDLESFLEQHFCRLTDAEKQVIAWMANEYEAVDFSKLPVNLKLSKLEGLKVLQSLSRRCLIEKVKEGEETFFTLLPVFKEYVKLNLLA